MDTIFLLSPASCAGRRAQMVLRREAAFPLATRLRSEGAELGEVFSFLSGLYFRGKLTYARAFGRAPEGIDAAPIITTNRGLLSSHTIVRHEDMCAFGTVPIDVADSRYRAPLERDARALREAVPHARVVLLGSIASDKYVDIFLDVFGDSLLFPGEFVGRGDMSRGGLLLRKVEEGLELDYIPVAGAIRRGVRPPRLEPKPRAKEPRAKEPRK